MRILMQFPEGLKQKAAELAEKYRNEGHEVFLSASACYGACDLALDEARWLRADKIVHFGHNRFVQSEIPIEVEYVEYKVDIDISRLGAVLPLIQDHKAIGLATTVQHLHQFPEMRRFFEKQGKTVFSEKGFRTETGQVLGCDAGCIMKVLDSIDAALFVGNGRFHALAIDIGKPVFVIDPYSGEARELSRDIEKAKKKRLGAIAKALTSKRFGILLSTKPGQFSEKTASWAKKELERRNLRAEILVANEMEPMALNNFVLFECFVNTACPRLSEDNEEMGKPILDIPMLKELFILIDRGSG